MDPDFSVTIAGAAGQGLVSLSQILLKVLLRNGNQVFASQDYMSRVRGGHNFMKIRIGCQSLFSSSEFSNILVALDGNSIDVHKNKLAKPELIISDFKKIKARGIKGKTKISVPASQIAREAGGLIYGNSVLIGALVALLNIGKDHLPGIFSQYFRSKGKDVIAGNVQAAEKGFIHVKRNFPEVAFDLRRSRKKRMLINGAQAIGLGMIAGGLKFIAAYPMSPSTGIFNYVISKASEAGVIFEQAEDEIAAINMALGASAGGARSAVTTSGGGLALMAEGISLSGVAEIPIVIANIQRPGPGTGLPTRTGQEDLDFVLSIGHGEFPRFVFAPGTQEEAFYTAVSAMNLAGKYQVPVFIIGDQHLVDSYRTVDPLNEKKVRFSRYLLDPKKSGKPYLRYRISRSGVSKRAYYGQIGQRIMHDSHAHTESGFVTEDQTIARRMVEKRFRKLQGMKKEGYGPSCYGQDNPAVLLISWGSTYGAVRETVDVLNERGEKASMVHYNRIWPFPVEDTLRLLKGKQRIHVVENNYQSQFARLLKRESGIPLKDSILRYDGRPFNSHYLMSRLQEIYGWRN